MRQPDDILCIWGIWEIFVGKDPFLFRMMLRGVAAFNNHMGDIEVGHLSVV